MTMNKFELQTAKLLASMVEQMLEPDHDGYSGHEEDKRKGYCGMCIVLNSARQLNWID